MPTRHKLWIVVLTALVSMQGTISLLWHPGRALMIASDLIQATLLCLAMAAFLPNCFPSHSPVKRTRAFWILMSAGMGFWLTYQGMWIYFEVLRNQDVPNPFMGDIVLFLHLVPMMAALSLLPHLGEDDRDARLRTLDFALLLIWWVFVYVYAVIPWQTVDVNEPAYSANFNATYLTEKLALLVALILLTYHSHGGWRYLYANLLGATALYASSSYVANYAIGRHTYYSGSLYDIPLIISVAWIAAIGKFAARFHLPEAKPSQPLVGVWITRVGMLALFTLPWFALYAQMRLESPQPVKTFRTVLTLITMVVMGMLVFLRQRLLRVELASLLERSRDSFEDLKLLQSQLIQSEKLASLGQLVGGAAHEINNPLTAMLGYSDLLSNSSLPPHEQVLADRIAAQVRRTRTLVSSLLTFVRQSPAQLSGKDVNSIVQTAMRLLAPQLEVEETQVRMECASNLPMVSADSNQLLHVFLHLAGQICGRTGSGDNNGLYVQTGQENGAVLIDLGSPSIHTDSPFEPLKDIEKISKRASLSLGACCRIVEEHGGRILARAAPEGYSTFRVELPISKMASEQAHHTRASAAN